MSPSYPMPNVKPDRYSSPEFKPFRHHSRRLTGCLGLLLILLAGTFSNACNATEDKSAHVKASLISEAAAVVPGETFWIALRLEIEPHWHTYYKNPGDSGLATTVEWTPPPGFKIDGPQWTIPQRIVTSSLTSFAYEKEALHFFRVEVSKDALQGPVTLQGHASWLVCKESCLPGEANLTLPLEVGPTARSSEWKTRLEQARHALPGNFPPDSLKAAHSKNLLELSWPESVLSGPSKKLFFIPDEEGVVEYQYQTPKPRSTDAENRLVLRMPKAIHTAWPERVSGLLVAPQKDGTSHAVRVDAILSEMAEPPPDSAPETSPLSLLGMILAAFAGGLLLNLMPCVFPVLSLKVLGFVRQSGGNPMRSRLHGLAFAAGVLVSFWILSGILLILRSSGEELGWGFQLQNSGFVLFLTFLFFLIALNLSGLFEIGLSFTGLSTASQNHGGFGEAFLGGVLATLVATPCTAPFMGTALGFALAQPPVISLLTFTSLGLGMALPFTLLTWIPKLVTLLPRPGAWMETFKQILAYPLFLTIVWLLWLYGNLSDLDELIRALTGLTVLAFACWIYGRWSTPAQNRRVQIASGLSALLLGLGAILYAYAEGGKEDWIDFSQETVEALREKQPVFIDFTAAWCLTCQANKKIALNRETVRNAFKEHNVALVRADWTHTDPSIARALEQFGRQSVPLYVLYPKGKDSEPILLPETLVPSIVLDALKQLPK